VELGTAGGGMSSVWGATDVAWRDEGAVLCEMKYVEGKAEETEPSWTEKSVINCIEIETGVRDVYCRQHAGRGITGITSRDSASVHLVLAGALLALRYVTQQVYIWC
jgi:hypothetical protein